MKISMSGTGRIGSPLFYGLALLLLSRPVFRVPTAAGQKQSEPIRVFVFTATSPEGFVDANSQQRSDSVEDLKKILSKNPLIQIVPDAGGAAVTLEVLGRGHQETGSTTSTYSYGQWHTYPDTVRVVRVGLRAGTYTTLFEGTSGLTRNGLVGAAHGLWRVAADNASKGIENWVKANHDKLISLRVDAPSAIAQGSRAGSDSVVPTRTELSAASGVSSPRAARGWIGLSTTKEGNATTTVSRVVPGSPAARAGIQVGDVITQIDDDAVTSGEVFESRVARCKPGVEIRVRYMRGYWLSQATVTVGEE